MPKYTCEKCGRIFKQKSGYTDHQSKKNDCSQNTIIGAIIQSAVEIKVNDAIRAIQPKPPITDKIMLPSFFEDLHNLLWNKAGLNPEKALEHMTFFFAYRLIEQQADALVLPQECRWSYIANIQNEQDLFDEVRRGVSGFRNNPKTKPFFKPHEIQRCDIVSEIVQQINRISLTTLQETDTLGDVFEYMLGRGMSTMSDEGQYFTNREICRLAFKLSYQIKQTLRREDGTLCTFGDWFCGTGGFPAEYVKGVKAYLPDIDWQTECGSIYCQDMNTSSVTTTLLNMLILTGIPFSDQNIRSSNSFTDTITKGPGAPFSGLLLDYCFMNPPYGGDKTKGKEYKFAYSKTVKAEDGTKTKRFYVNQEIQSIGIEDDDKVSAGVQLGMASLSDGGVCSLVLPQGFFFGASKKCVELRKKIAHEYKIWYVVNIASGSFINTGTKTSMIIFQKGVGPTDRVSFIGLDETLLVEATLEELVAKNYSLNYKQYMIQNVVEAEGFQTVKLGDIVKPISMKHRSTPDGNDVGKYPLISSALNVEYYMDTCDSETPSLIFNTINADGNCSVHYYEKFNVTSNTYVLSCPNKVTLQYIYYYLKTQQELLKNCFEGTTKKALSRPLLQAIDIPIPSLERQQQIVESIDCFTQLMQHEKQAVKMLEKQVMFFAKEMGRGQPCVKLSDILKPVKGKRYAVSEGKNTGKYPLLRSSKDGKVKWMDDYTYEGPFITVGNGGQANFRLIEKFNASTHTIVYDVNQNCIKDFAYYSIQNMRNVINEMCFQGTGLENLNIDMFMDIEIQLPPIADQQMLQSDFEEIRHKHAKIDEYKKKAQDAIKLLIPGA